MQTSHDVHLARDLRSKVRGEVRFGFGSRALYSTAGGNYRYVPIGVVVPRDIEDVVAAVSTCRDHQAPILARGGGTSLAGQTANVAVIFDFSKYMTQIIDVDPDARRARVQPGVVLDSLRDEAERYGLTFGPDPATHAYCTLGGMIGNNSCGIHSVMAGRTSDNVEELHVLTYSGHEMHVGRTRDGALQQIVSQKDPKAQIYSGLQDLRDRYADEIRTRYPKIPRRVSGYNLDELLPENDFNVARALVGTEGTCALVLDATVRLVPSPPVRALLVLGYPDVYSAADHSAEILKHSPIGLEGIDDRLVGYMRKKGAHPHDIELLPDGGGWLLVEFGGDTRQEADDRARSLMKELDGGGPNVKLFDDPDEEKKVWEIRESGLGATAFVPGERATWEGWEDSAVPPERLGPYLRDLRALLDRYDYACSFYGHFGDGCLHTRIDFDLKTEPGIQKYRSFIEEAADLVIGYGGSLSGEHGDGQSRAELLPRMFGDELVEAFRRFKAIWDPDGKMNPHKVVDPYRLDENLRLGPTYRPPTLKTHFSFVHEGGSFADAAARCVGVGKCRKLDGGTMCPSYMVTKEEKHTTRGRARLLFEMLRGDPLQGGWRDKAVHEALELCLACKGCKGECPVEVDMATYKSEFYSHYYRGKFRPIQAYSLGLIYWWARAAARVPRFVNALTHGRRTGRIAKAVAGLAPQRTLPEFATETFTDWFAKRPTAGPHRQREVLLWPDTFNNFLNPDVGRAAVEVLEAGGCDVKVPPRPLCCGRPLYDYGMLSTAKRLLRQALKTLRPQLEAGTPVVGIEPSCVAVFRDELTNLLPHDEDAVRLSKQVFTLAEFLEQIDYDPPKQEGKALVHRHCHHQAVMGFDADRRVLTKTGLDFDIIDSGCCGLAGSFGFERGEKYDVSLKCAERELAPAVRALGDGTLVLADGFSCQTQIEHLTGRKPLHLAQLLERGLHDRRTGVE
ncbi:MAG: FAD-binding oxidoreductase [Actinomycetota bacterium]|nr:FAD-binding oxidoreductase [Actinomycetota bacterium]